MDVIQSTFISDFTEQTESLTQQLNLAKFIRSVCPKKGSYKGAAVSPASICKAYDNMELYSLDASWCEMAW